uniref:Ovule protein n=1 Tax=Mesocestoides corti TaxID=53468 RepID=A0A5K3ERQ1_MESCO
MSLATDYQLYSLNYEYIYLGLSSHLGLDISSCLRHTSEIQIHRSKPHTHHNDTNVPYKHEKVLYCSPACVS